MSRPLLPQVPPYLNAVPNPANVIQMTAAPTSAYVDQPLGTIALYNGAAYLLVAKTSSSATWNLLESSGGAGVFNTLSSSGTTTLNTSGSAVTTIGTGGTGAVNIGNTSGNTAVTGSLTASTTLTASSGNITATNGDFVASAAGKGVVLGGGAKVVCGTGDPNTAVTAPQGSLYLRLDGSSSSTRAYINSDSATTWIAVTTAS